MEFPINITHRLEDEVDVYNMFSNLRIKVDKCITDLRAELNQVGKQNSFCLSETEREQITKTANKLLMHLDYLLQFSENIENLSKPESKSDDINISERYGERKNES